MANTKEPMFDTARLRRSLAEVLGQEPSYNGVPFEVFEYQGQGETVRFEVEDRHYILRPEHYKLLEIEPLSDKEIDLKTPRTWKGRYGWLNLSETLSPDGKWCAGIEDHNLYFPSTSDGRKVTVTDKRLVKAARGLRISID